MAHSERGKNAVYVQAGGVTAVINASAFGVIRAFRDGGSGGKLFAGLDGIHGVLEERLIDLSREAPQALAALRHTPAGAFGTCRVDLGDPEQDRAQFQRVLDVCDAHDIGIFLYNGGNGSMATAAALAAFAEAQGFPLCVVGIPKSIDNDIAVTDTCPGFGSVAKYNSISMMEASLDTRSMSRDSTKVFILEVMGRNAGWIAASTGLASRSDEEGPHLILFPEIPFDQRAFLRAVERSVSRHGICAVTVSEGLQDEQGRFVAEVRTAAQTGYNQLGGAGQFVQLLVQRELDVKVHNAVPDYCQRSARHIASAVDVSHAIACGAHAVALAARGMSGVMVMIRRTSQHPYEWALGHVEARAIAGQEKIVPPNMIRADGLHVTQKFRDYCLPLIQGEEVPPYQEGLPVYAQLKRLLLRKRLPEFKAIEVR